MKRTLAPELLDELPAADPLAVGSRKDLLRLNRLMGHPGFMLRILRSIFKERPPAHLVEIGAGDGATMLFLARSLKWRGVEVWLIDRQKVISPATLRGIEQSGWKVNVLTIDALEGLTWIPNCDCVLANLFLHHFRSQELGELLQKISEKSNAMIACEPRRDAFALNASAFLGLLGCNSVTRHDARISIRAGFLGTEISSLWPDPENWELEERSKPLFSHVFVARKTPAA